MQPLFNFNYNAMYFRAIEIGPKLEQCIINLDLHV